MPYLDLPLDTPAKYTNCIPGGKVIIISGGASTNNILKYKDRLKSIFEKVIVVNSSFKYFDDIADFHIMVEKVSPTAFNKMYLDLNAGDYRTDTPRIFNWKGINHYNKKYNIHKLVRNNFNGKPNLRSYSVGKQEGLFVGPPSTRNMALGTVVLPSMHFAGILGASEIYLSGVDLLFKDNFDHFYNDKVYRNTDGQKFVKPANRVHIVDVIHNDKKYQTTDYFKESAQYLNTAINTIFKDAGIKVYDFSDGLLTNAIPIKIENLVNKG